MTEEERVEEIYNLIAHYNIAKKQKDFDLFKFCKKHSTKGKL